MKRIVKLEIGAGQGVSSVRAESELFPGTLVRVNRDEFGVPRNAIGINGEAETALVGIKRLLAC